MAAFPLPTDADVEAFLSLVPDLPRAEAIQRLKGNNNNIEQALGEYFDNPNSLNEKYGWNEQQFNSDRDGNTNNHGISFDIQGPDDPGPYGPRQFDGGAPSRPPSRTSNNKSPLSKIIDLTAEHAAADPRTSMSHNDHADRELEEALAASRADLGMPPQESGITGTDQVHFGPATRSQYEHGKWDIVHVPTEKSSVQEIILDPAPADRKRAVDAPAFLKPSIANHRLNALITIYHEIPLLRSIFLNTTDTIPNYGYSNEWWSGTAISFSRTSVSSDEDQVYPEIARELQRLMAFLDKTDRSYGSVDALASLPEVQREERAYGHGIESSTLSAWAKNSKANNMSGIVNQIFSVGVAGEEREELEEKEFAILELLLPHKDSAQDSLYDIADETLWPDLGPTELTRSPYLSRIAEVIAFRIEGGDESRTINIPAVWYPDRYLKNGRQAALDMRLQKRKVVEVLHRIIRQEEFLTYAPLPSGRIAKVTDLVAAALRHDEAELEKDRVEDVEMMESQRSSKAATRLSEELKKMMASIDKKLSSLNEEKEKAHEALKNLSRLFTEPTNDPEEPRLHKYTLRGVSTTKSTMYICRRAEPNLIDVDVDSGETNGVVDQWWKIQYTPTGSSSVAVEKTTEAKVLEAAKSDSKNTILVYASEKAMDYQNIALPKPLETFVRWDNTTFRNECEGAEGSQGSGDSETIIDDPQPVGISSPGKRKYHESSLVNQDSHQNGGVNVSEKELRNGETSVQAPRPLKVAFGSPLASVEEEISPLLGVDPSLVTKEHEDSNNQEMQERGMPMLTGRPANSNQTTIDSMDMDQVMEDAEKVEGSAATEAVRHEW